MLAGMMDCLKHDGMCTNKVKNVLIPIYTKQMNSRFYTLFVYKF